MEQAMAEGGGGEAGPSLQLLPLMIPPSQQQHQAVGGVLYTAAAADAAAEADAAANAAAAAAGDMSMQGMWMQQQQQQQQPKATEYGFREASAAAAREASAAAFATGQVDQETAASLGAQMQVHFESYLSDPAAAMALLNDPGNPAYNGLMANLAQLGVIQPGQS